MVSKSTQKEEVVAQEKVAIIPFDYQWTTVLAGFGLVATGMYAFEKKTPAKKALLMALAIGVVGGVVGYYVDKSMYEKNNQI